MLKPLYKKNEFFELSDRETLKPKGKNKKNNHVGLELEILAKVPRDILDWESKKLGLDKYIQIGTDGSIRREEYYPYVHEIRCLIQENELDTVVPQITEFLQSMGAKANQSCGFHVHLDMRNRNASKSYTKLVNGLKTLKKDVAKYRLKNSYCPLNKVKDFKMALNGKVIKRSYVDGWGTRVYYSDRQGQESRAAINPHAYKKHKTIEVRLHQGTVKSGKILSWVKKLIKTVDGEPKKKAS